MCTLPSTPIPRNRRRQDCFDSVHPYFTRFPRSKDPQRGLVLANVLKNNSSDRGDCEMGERAQDGELVGRAVGGKDDCY